MPTSAAYEAFQRLRQDINQVIIEQAVPLDIILAALLSGGHVLVEDVPGSGKTVTMRSLAQLCGGEFQRIQCTPDLLPSDATGVAIYNQKSGDFTFHPGPIFSQFVLADEINRTTPRTQSAFLEAMAEGQVTIDRQTHPLPQPFFLMATQNPIEYEGTFPLPEAQLDRFAVLVRFNALSRSGAMRLLQQGEVQPDHLRPLLDANVVLTAQREVRGVHVSEPTAQYIVALCESTQQHLRVLLGMSNRAHLVLLRVAQAWAWLRGSEFVELEDIQAIFPAVAAHRMRLDLPYTNLLQRTSDTLALLKEIIAATEAKGSWQTPSATHRPRGGR